MDNNEILKSISSIYLADFENSNHFSTFSAENNYQVLILRSFSISADELVFNSRNFVIIKKSIYEYIDGDFEIKSYGIESVHDLINPIYRKNNLIIEEFISEVDKLEDNLYERKTSRVFMDNWFDLKKDLSRIERYYSRNHTVLNSFYKNYASENDFPHSQISDLLNDISYVVHNVGSQSSRLDALHNYYSSIKDEKLNNNLYTLTVLSAFFLPLNLIVGFFGMNTEGLYFKDNPQGTQYVFVILLSVFFLAFIGIPLIKILDKYLLQFLLGKSHIYKTITKKINKIDDILNIS
jgi:uncharacterized protein YukE